MTGLDTFSLSSGYCFLKYSLHISRDVIVRIFGSEKKAEVYEIIAPPIVIKNKIFKKGDVYFHSFIDLIQKNKRRTNMIDKKGSP